MDRLIYTALNSLANLRGTQITTAQNLANQNVPGFRRDYLPEGQSFVMEDQGDLQARAFQVPQEQAAFARQSGFLNQTDQPLDIALADRGWFYIAPETGGAPALSRRGDLQVATDGILRTGAGDAILDQALQPIAVPPFRSLTIDEIGTISIEPIDGEPGERVDIATLATTLAPGTALTKGLDGQIRPTGGGPLPPPDQGGKVLQGVLEGSNVNATEELISSIDLQRSFELNLRLISSAKELDEAGTRLLRMPEA